MSEYSFLYLFQFDSQQQTKHQIVKLGVHHWFRKSYDHYSSHINTLLVITGHLRTISFHTFFPTYVLRKKLRASTARAFASAHQLGFNLQIWAEESLPVSHIL